MNETSVPEVCQLCGQLSTKKPFAFKGNNVWDPNKRMHRGCADAEAVEKVTEQGAAGLKAPEGELYPNPTIRKTAPDTPEDKSDG